MNAAAFHRWDWAITLVFVVGNGLWLKGRADRFGVEFPELDPGFQKIVKGFFLYLGGPCLLWGLGTVTGWSNFLSFQGYPLTVYDWLYFGLGVLILAKSIVWIYFRGGAAFLARHGMLFRYWPSSAMGTKIVWALMSAAVLAGIGETVVRGARP